MLGLDRIRSRRAVLREEIASARLRIATRRRMVELEIELAEARHPASRLVRHGSWVLPLVAAAVVGGRRRARAGVVPGGGIAGPVVSVLAALVPVLVRRFGGR